MHFLQRQSGKSRIAIITDITESRSSQCAMVWWCVVWWCVDTHHHTIAHCDDLQWTHRLECIYWGRKSEPDRVAWHAQIKLCCVDSLKSAIASQFIDNASPPVEVVCPYPSMQLLEPVTSLEVSKLLSTIPPKSCCLDYIPTAIIKQRSPVFSDPHCLLG